MQYQQFQIKNSTNTIKQILICIRKIYVNMCQTDYIFNRNTSSALDFPNQKENVLKLKLTGFAFVLKFLFNLNLKISNLFAVSLRTSKFVCFHQIAFAFFRHSSMQTILLINSTKYDDINENKNDVNRMQ